MPSIFTTPVLSISPTIFIPDAMTDSPVSGRGASFRIRTFSVVGFVKIDIDTYSGCGRSIDGRAGVRNLTSNGGRIGGHGCAGRRTTIGVLGVRRYGSLRCGRLLPRGGVSADGEHLADLLIASMHSRQRNLQRINTSIVPLQLRNAHREDRNTHALCGKQYPRDKKWRGSQPTREPTIRRKAT